MKKGILLFSLCMFLNAQADNFVFHIGYYSEIRALPVLAAASLTNKSYTVSLTEDDAVSALVAIGATCAIVYCAYKMVNYSKEKPTHCPCGRTLLKYEH